MVEKELYQKFVEIKKMNWVKSQANGKSGIGITFENLIGVTNNNFEIPDYNGIEIKTKRKSSWSYITLFSATPNGPHFHEVERLKNKFGYPHSKQPDFKVLNVSIFANKKKKVGINYYFKLKIDKKEEKMFLLVYDKNYTLIENDVFWYLEDLQEKLYRKLKILAFVKAETKRINEIEYFKYYQMSLYQLKNFNTFIYLLEKGIIRVSFKINVYLNGPKKGKICDHGTSFEIQEKDLLKLYTPY